MNFLFPSLFWIALSLLSAIPLLVWRGRLSPRQQRVGYLCRWLFIPYLGLITGALSPRLMGLGGIDWLVSLQIGVGLVLALVVLLILVRATVGPLTAPPQDGAPQLGFPASTLGPVFQPVRWAYAIRTPLITGAEQFHWCFLRAAVQESILLGVGNSPPPMYAALWIATLLSAPEALLRVDTHLQRFVPFVSLVATAALFFLTYNFWLCWLLHALMVPLCTLLTPAAAQHRS